MKFRMMLAVIGVSMLPLVANAAEATYKEADFKKAEEAFKVCAKNQIVVLDDSTSSADVIARAAAQKCEAEAKHYADTVAYKNWSPSYREEFLYTAMSGQQFVPDVLERRNAQNR